MFLFKVFAATTTANKAAAEHRDHHCNDNATGTVKSTKQKVVTVEDEADEGFARVEFRPLTYAEVATLNESPAEADSARERTFNLSLSDVYGPDDGDLMEASYEEQTASGVLYESGPVRLLTTATLGSNVVSEFEYGERARRFAAVEDGTGGTRRWKNGHHRPRHGSSSKTHSATNSVVTSLAAVGKLTTA
jgi:hypothetical protein